MSIGEEGEKREPGSVVAGNAGWYSHYGNSTAAPQRIKNKTTLGCLGDSVSYAADTSFRLRS